MKKNNKHPLAGHAGQNSKGSRSVAYEVTVLRLGHRLVRDERMSTHIGLVSRAFGAKNLILTGADDHTVDSINRVKNNWGGEFEVKYVRNWRQFVLASDGIIVHLTMYGEVLDQALAKIRRDVDKSPSSPRKILVIVGAEKVPSEVYELATYNASVGNQPHSEVAALAVFLDRLFMGEELYTTFVKAKLRINPSLRQKNVVEMMNKVES
ncbi:MAG: tRNA (cytidine(56)-2'-O)-methyltransferase [Rhabdochlamydiaceae bacterium]